MNGSRHPAVPSAAVVKVGILTRLSRLFEVISSEDKKGLELRVTIGPGAR